MSMRCIAPTTHRSPRGFAVDLAGPRLPIEDDDDRFPMSLDAGHGCLTPLALASAGWCSGCSSPSDRPPVAWIPLLTAACLLPIVGICWALVPTGLARDAGALRIERRTWRPLEIPLRDIAALESAPGMRMPSTVRLFGVGGFLGTYGLMWSRPLGRFGAYATRSAPSLVLR